VSANDPNFVQAVEEWFYEEHLSDVDLNHNEPILISHHGTNSELSETHESEDYTGEKFFTR
jgi:hypothetical protein